MNDYKFRLYPYNNFVKGLCSVSSNDFSIHDDSDSDLGETDVHLLSSSHLNVVSDIDELASKLKGLMMLLNGALAVLHGFERIKTLGVLEIDGSEGVNYSDIVKFKELDVTQKSPFDFNNTCEMHDKADHFSRLINLSSKNEPLRVVLGMCAIGSDWVNLYRIWETIQHYIFERYKDGLITFHEPLKANAKQLDVICKYLSIDREEVKRFTGTANSFELLGYLGRHGKGSTNALSNPMSRVEASQFVNRASRMFCNIYLR